MFNTLQMLAISHNEYVYCFASWFEIDQQPHNALNAMIYSETNLVIAATPVNVGYSIWTSVDSARSDLSLFSLIF